MKLEKTLIIAEAGVNHNGSLDTAMKLVETAAESGADVVKFQTFKADNLVCVGAPKADYQNRRTDSDETQQEMIRKLELSKSDHEELIAHCSKFCIRFASTAFDIESINLIKDLGVDFFKIPSGEITNLPYLRHIGRLNMSIVLSTGMSCLEEIDNALKVLGEAGTVRSKITVLHCNTEYPTPMEDVNLKAMLTIGEELNVKVGYSDHTLGIEVPIAAVALGAQIIEKHFTLDRELPGPDHAASLEPLELKQMVRAIRNIEKSLGDGIKQPSPSERKNIQIVRKSIVASRKISKGDIFTQNNLMVKRPGHGISPMQWDEVMGKEAPCSFDADDLIEL